MSNESIEAHRQKHSYSITSISEVLSKNGIVPIGLTNRNTGNSLGNLIAGNQIAVNTTVGNFTNNLILVSIGFYGREQVLILSTPHFSDCFTTSLAINRVR